jgi:hypothetical protein
MIKGRRWRYLSFESDRGSGYLFCCSLILYPLLTDDCMTVYQTEPAMKKHEAIFASRLQNNPVGCGSKDTIH